MTAAAAYASRTFYLLLTPALFVAAAAVGGYGVFLLFLGGLFAAFIFGVVAFRITLLAQASHHRARYLGRKLAGVQETNPATHGGLTLVPVASSRLFRIGDIFIFGSIGLEMLLVVVSKSSYFPGVPAAIGGSVGFVFYIFAVVKRMRGL